MSKNELTEQVLPIDIGFGYTKSIFKERNFIQPSVVGEPRDLFEEDVKDNDFQIGSIQSPSLYRTNGFESKYFVGNLSLRKSNVRYYSIADDKAATWTTKVLLSTALGHLAPNDDVVVVTGLPIDFYFKQRQDMSDFLTNFNTYDPFSLKVGHTIFPNLKPTILKSIVTLQPMGAAMNYILDDDGQFRDRQEASKIYVIGDLGFHTFDLLVLDGMEIHRYSHSEKEISISNAYSLIQDWIKSQIGSAPDIYQLDMHILKGEYQGIDLQSIIEKTFNALAKQIQFAVDSLNLNYHKYIGTGGWSSLITPLMNIHKDKTVIYGQMGNVEGFRKVGVRSCKM